MFGILGNIVWLIFGGFEMALGWFFAGIVMAITIVGLPWAPACFRIGVFTLWPFGREVLDRELVTGLEDIGTGPLGCLANVIWFLLLGLWLALGHVLMALVLFVTIIGIPFGLQHWKLAKLALAPVGKSVIPIN